MANVAELFVKHQVNLILICFETNHHQFNIAKNFVERINELSADKIMPLEAFLLTDPTPEEVEELMITQRVANYKIPKNSPLIIETFM